MGSEKRLHPRFPLVLTVDYPGNGTPFRDRTENLSASGLLIRTDREFDVGERVELVVSVPVLAETALLEVEVIRFRPGQGGTSGSVAVRIPDERVADRLRFERLVAAAEAAFRSPALRVLVAEDNPLVARMLATAVRRIAAAAGREPVVVDLARDGRDAFARLLAPRPFDLVLADLQMPVMDGFTLLGRIREEPRLRDLPVVVVTACGDEEQDAARRLGANAVLRKPVPFPELAATLGALFGLGGVPPAAPVAGETRDRPRPGGAMYDSPSGLAPQRDRIPFDPGGARGAE